MARKLTLTIGLLVACAWCFSLVSPAANSEPTSGAAFKPVASVHSLMEGQGLVFSQLQMALGNKNAAQRAKQIHSYAEVLAELANVNTFNNEKADYRGWATQLRDTALALAAEGKKNPAPDEGKVNELFSKIKNTCQACHDVYQN